MNIIIKQNYFTNIQTAINSLNDFFSSGFKTKNFPIIDGDYQLDIIVERIISRLDAVDPTWLSDESKYVEIIKTINDNLNGIDPVDGVYQTIVNSNNQMMLNVIDSYIGFKILQFIADNFQDFTKFINGIYTFEIFTKPSQYAEILDMFSQPIHFDEVPDLDIDEKIFDESIYVDGIMKNELIQVPEDMIQDNEVERIIGRKDLEGVEVLVDDAVQEAAEINYFENTKPAHMKYSENSKKWMISKQFEKVVNDLISALRKCDTTDDLMKFFGNGMDGIAPDKFLDNVCPFILTKVFANPKKYQGTDPKENALKNYTDSYDSILKQNSGANRFKNYDLFSTFKTDKDGTIQFIEDFLKLNLINKEDVTINNNTLLTIFNIFDSRIYLDIAYNLAPESIKNEKGEDAFVKEIRSRINKNSHSVNAYSKESTTDETNTSEVDDTGEIRDESTPDTTESVNEYVTNELIKLGDMSITDMLYCENYSDLIESEIDTMGDRLYNLGISPFLVEEYIGESFNEINNHLDGFIMEADVKKQRETFQQGVCCLMAEMEEIVKLNKQHRWNANTFASRYVKAFSLNPLGGLDGLSLLPGASEQHTNIKQVYHSTKKALKGKRGNFTPEQTDIIKQLNRLVSELWKNVSFFWINPRNWSKEIGLFKNDKTQKRTRNIAEIAQQIVDLKPDLEFIIDNDDFVNEAWYDGSSEYVFQEATTEKNNKRLNIAMSIIMRDMKKISELAKQNQWTNNACISMFKGETYGNVKQAIKYVNRGASGACGKFDDSQKEELKKLCEKLEEILRTVKLVSRNPLIGKNIKESNPVHKIASIATEIVGMQSNFEFIKSIPTNDSTSSSTANDTSSDDKTTTESFELDYLDIKSFAMYMEQEDGTIPEYMKTRLKMNDEIGKRENGNSGTSVTPVDLPPDIPQNPIPELTDSIDTKINTKGDSLDDVLGIGYENNPNKSDNNKDGKTVINITNNYTNSFNRDSGNTKTITTDDHSTGKHTSTNNSNSNNNHLENVTSDSSSNKSTKSSHVDRKSSKVDNSNHSKTTKTDRSNNNNNSNDSNDIKDSPTFEDNKKKLSSGKTIQEMFMILESSEPQQSLRNNAVKPPKEDTLTKAMDRDRETLSKQQSAKKGTQKIINTSKAGFKPIVRTKQWLTKVTDSLIKRDEDKVKTELTENASYRSSVHKAMRIALHTGAIGIAFALQPYLGVTALAVEGLRLADRNRLKKEVQKEAEVEIKIIDEKIKDLDHIDSAESRRQKYEYMRLKGKLESQLISSPKRAVKSSHWDSY